MKNLKELIILHSNDMHGDFLAEQIDEKLVGGVSLLSGYVNMVRNQEKNVLYAIAGDMFRGSVIDSEYKGVSTIGIMNLLGPDVATIGNHEVDYGLAHLLFLEKCANFPIINANFHIRSNHKRLFQPHYIAEIDGMKILFIGIITEDVLAQTKAEEAKNHPDKNIITRAIGAKADVDVDFYEHRLKRGDIILMCTDGLSNMVEDEELFHIVQGSRDIVEAGEMLVEAAKENGGTDNIGVVLFEPFADEVSV